MEAEQDRQQPAKRSSTKSVTQSSYNQATHKAIVKASDELSESQAKQLHKATGQLKLKRKALDDEGDEHDHHAHKEKAPSVLTAFAAAVINFLLMFGLCCAYGMIMFEHDWNAQHRGLAVKMNLSTAFFVGLLLAFFSKVPVAIGGPDLNPVVFLGMFISTIAEELAKEHNLTYPDVGSRRLFEADECDSSMPEQFLRFLAAKKSDVEFCTGSHLLAHAEDCRNYHLELRATAIFAVAFSSAVLGILYFCLGRFKLTGFVSYVPANIMEAFLSCVGYKVFKYALLFCNYEPKQFIPAACIGVPLYFVKALHVGNPAIVIPTMLLVPLAIFYTLLYATGGDVASARGDGWFFAEIENAQFYQVWTDSLNLENLSSGGSFAEHINFKAWSKTFTVFPIMIIVCMLDCLLKLSSTESKLPVKAPKDYEIRVYGASNLVTTLTGSSVGYMQLKFNVINFGVMGNVKDRRGGIFYALLCGICYFWSTDLFNFLPRFFLSTLLFFAGSGFVAENLWGSRKYLSIAEWLQIFFILAIFIFSGSLLYAVIVGGLLAGGQFIVRYARIPSIQGRPQRGYEVVPMERRSLLMQRAIRHASGAQLMVIKLKGFVFFASAQKMTAWVAKQIEAQADLPPFRRMKWLVVECENLDGMDSSALKAMAKVRGIGQANEVQFIWTSMKDDFRKQLQKMDIIQGDSEWFDTFEEALEFTDSIIVERVMFLQNKFELIEPNFEIAHKLACQRDRFDPFKTILPSDAQRFGCPWQFCGRFKIKAFETVLWKPQMRSVDLLLIHSGKVGIYRSIPTDCSGTWRPPVNTYSHGWFLNRQALLHGSTRDYGVALEDGEVIFWNEFQWSKMVRENPSMASAIMQAVLQQQAYDTDLAESSKTVLLPQAPEEAQEEGFQRQTSGETSIGGEIPSRFTFSADNLAPNSPGPSLESDDLDTQRVSDVNGDGAEIQQIMRRLLIAQALDEAGFFVAVPPNEEYNLPKIPPRILEDVNIAFDTYAKAQANSKELKIPSDDVAAALRYAGLYYIALHGFTRDSLARTEFTSLCLRALLTPLSQAKATQFREMFRKHHAAHPASVELDPTGDTVDRGELVVLFKDLFKFDVPAHHIDGIADVWGQSHGQRIDVESAIAVLSRFLQRHMVDLCILNGIRKLTGKTHLSKGDAITADMLTTAVPSLNRELADEMIWAADFLNDSFVPGESITVTSLALVLNMSTDLQAELPPPPKLTDVPGGKRQYVVDVDDAWVRKAMLDFRHAEQWTPPAKNLEQKTAYEAPEEIAEEIEAIPNTWQAKLLLLLDYPESSPAANLISVVMGIMILISVLTLFLEPLISPKNEAIDDVEKSVWFAFELFFTVLFTIEYIVTFAVCNALGTQTRFGFLKEPMRICDFVAVLPFYIDQTIDADQEEFRLFRIARLMRLSRLVRLGRLAKRSATFAPIAMILVVIWGIYMKNGLKE